MSNPTKKASEFRNEMREKGLSSDLIDRIVKSEIAAGTVTDDGAAGVLAGVPVDLITKAAESIDAALNAQAPEADPILASRDFGDDALGRLSYVESVAKAAASNGEMLIDYQHEVFPALLKGQKAVGLVLQGFMDAMTHFAGELDTIKKGMRDPGAPRGASAEGGFLPHPSEQKTTDAIAKGGEAPQGARVTPINARVLRDQLVEAREDLISKGAEANRRDIENIGSAIAALESGVTSSDVIKRFKINFKAA